MSSMIDIVRTVEDSVSSIVQKRNPEPTNLVILSYHTVMPSIFSRSSVNVEPSMFEAQMDFLKKELKVQGLDQLSTSMSSLEPRVILTFDDATKDFFDVAYPILRDRGLEATVYVPTNFPDRDRFVNGYNMMSWGHLAQLRDDPNITLGVHGHTHRTWTHFTEGEARQEIHEMKKAFREKLDLQPQHFCYPKAMVPRDKAVADLLSSEFTTATIGNAKPISKKTSRMQLGRFPIRSHDSFYTFTQKAKGQRFLEERVRSFVAPMKYRKTES